MDEQNISLKDLYRQEFSRMVAVISNLFGLEHIEIAEDIVSETFLQATETWEQKGIPPNPVAWLYAVAKQKTLYNFRRNKIFTKKIIPNIKSKGEIALQQPDINFSEQDIKDSQLQMLFAVCNPAIANEAQIGLALRILCGFGIDEIAEAFLSNKETINKRLFRAKEKLREEKIVMEMPAANEIAVRVDNVLHILYLLFSEGYYSKTQNQVLRKDLCTEALRMAMMLAEYNPTNLPKVNALIALMCFHSSRFEARQTTENDFILYEKQNETLWNIDLINRGIHYLNLSAQGDELTSYHLEAQIAFHHCSKDDIPQKWESILQLYNQLLILNYSPSVALNRTYALYKANGREEAITQAEKLRLENNHFYFLLLGELYKGIDNEKSKLNLEKAYALAKTETEKQDIRINLNQLQSLTKKYE
ncbi:MAG: RNA polymerase subunit sigma [Bacteroidetes bacterium]|nr:RNA polymerase subunit sigma [Bacteroidota bacterium]